jgi:hypothetical protein
VKDFHRSDASITLPAIRSPNFDNNSDEPRHEAAPLRENVSVSDADGWNSEFLDIGIKCHKAWYRDSVSF